MVIWSYEHGGYFRQQPTPQRPGHITHREQPSYGKTVSMQYSNVYNSPVRKKTPTTMAMAQLLSSTYNLHNCQMAQPYCKPSNTNLINKPQSCQPPETSTATCKGELCRAYRISSSPEIFNNVIIH